MTLGREKGLLLQSIVVEAGSSLEFGDVVERELEGEEGDLALGEGSGVVVELVRLVVG